MDVDQPARRKLSAKKSRSGHKTKKRIVADLPKDVEMRIARIRKSLAKHKTPAVETTAEEEAIRDAYTIDTEKAAAGAHEISATITHPGYMGLVSRHSLGNLVNLVRDEKAVLARLQEEKAEFLRTIQIKILGAERSLAMLPTDAQLADLKIKFNVLSESRSKDELFNFYSREREQHSTTERRAADAARKEQTRVIKSQIKTQIQEAKTNILGKRVRQRPGEQEAHEQHADQGEQLDDDVDDEAEEDNEGIDDEAEEGEEEGDEEAEEEFEAEHEEEVEYVQN